MKESKTAQIEGGIPLVGDVKVSGSRTLALKLIYASIIGGESYTISNVPKVDYVLEDLEIASEMGVKALWSGAGKLSINSQDLKGYEIPSIAAKVTTTAFLIPALVHKFGKAILPKSTRFHEYSRIWESFGMEVKHDFDNLYIEATKLQSGEIVLPYPSRVLTDLAILTALFIPGESGILNASSDVETDDLIEFCNKMGADVKRHENSSIVVNGRGVFSGVGYTLPFDREELGFFTAATILTNGNTVLHDVDRARFLPFINWLSKIGANYEFSSNDMRVWNNHGSNLLSSQINVSPHPGFITDLAPLAVLLSCFASGESLVIENLLASNLNYIEDLNRLGAKIDKQKTNENIEIKINGPVKLKPGSITLGDLRYALVSLLYAVSVEGSHELAGYEIIDSGFEGITHKLESLGASIEVIEL